MADLKQHIATLQALLETVGYHSSRLVFRDFVELYAVALANALVVCPEREQRYQVIIKKYRERDRALFPKLFEQLVKVLALHPAEDYLGQTWMSLEGGSSRLGQYYTPGSITELLARLGTPEPSDLRRTIDELGFITVHDPAVGSGAIVIAQANHLLSEGINYQQHFHVTAWDIDLTAIHMAYVQFTLLHIPAVLVHGNTLTLVEHSRWPTLAHHLGAFEHKLRRGYALGSRRDVVLTEPGCASVLVSEREVALI